MPNDNKTLYTVPTEARHDMRASGVIVAALDSEAALKRAKRRTQDYQVPPVFAHSDSVREATARDIERSTALVPLNYDDPEDDEARFIYFGLDSEG